MVIKNNLTDYYQFDESIVKSLKKAKSDADEIMFFKEKLSESEALDIYKTQLAKAAHIFKKGSEQGEARVSLCWFPVYDVSASASGDYVSHTSIVGSSGEYFHMGRYQTDYYYKNHYAKTNGFAASHRPHPMIERIASNGGSRKKDTAGVLVYDDEDYLEDIKDAQQSAAHSQAYNEAKGRVEAKYNRRQLNDKDLRRTLRIDAEIREAQDSVSSSVSSVRIEYYPFYIVEVDGHHSLVNAIDGCIQIEGKIDTDYNRRIKFAGFLSTITALFERIIVVGTLCLFMWLAGFTWIGKVGSYFSRYMESGGYAKVPWLFVLIPPIVVVLLFVALFLFPRPNLRYSYAAQINNCLRKLKRVVLSASEPLAKNFVLFLLTLALVGAGIGFTGYKVRTYTVQLTTPYGVEY